MARGEKDFFLLNSVDRSEVEFWLSNIFCQANRMFLLFYFSNQGFSKFENENIVEGKTS